MSVKRDIEEKMTVRERRRKWQGERYGWDGLTDENEKVKGSWGEKKKEKDGERRDKN